jgi:hypothetical protein
MVLNIFETSKSRTSGDVQPRNDRNGIEMGKNSAYITGYEKSNMGDSSENLEGSVFKFHPDPYPEQQLFYRSDNATLARLGFLPIRYRHPNG